MPIQSNISSITVTSQSGQLIWSDDFNNPILDTSKWVAPYGIYTISNSNIIFGGGLASESKNRGGIRTIHTEDQSYSPIWSFKYGYIEARMKLANSNDRGFACTLWLYTPAGTSKRYETDIFEISTGPYPPDAGSTYGINRINSNFHDWNVFENGREKYIGTVKNTNMNLSSNYHTYGLEWTPDVLRWFFDGDKYFELTRGYLATQGMGFPDENMCILTDLCRKPPNKPSACWPSTTVSEDRPLMYVDYVRVYQE